MGLFIKYNCEECGFSSDRSQGSGRARPTESFNFDYIEYACRSCKTVGMQQIIHPVGKLKLQAENTYFIRIWIDLVKTNRFKNKWLQKLGTGFRWQPSLPENLFLLGRVYEENFLNRMDSYLSVSCKIKFTNFSLLESEKEQLSIYRKLVKVKAILRESVFSERIRKDNNWPSHEFVFELLTADKGNLTYLDDPHYGCPKCHSHDFRYGSAYCPMCDGQLSKENLGHWD